MPFKIESNFFSYQILNNSIKDYLIALIAFLGILIILWIFKVIVVKKLRKISQKTKTDLDDLAVNILSHAGWPFFYMLFSVYLALRFIYVAPFLNKIILYALIIIAAYLVVRSIEKVIDYGIRKIFATKAKKGKQVNESMIRLLGKAAKIVLWLVAIVLVAANFNYDVSALVASLGIGGIAIAFALQNILTDIFASFSIYFDRPFEIGDFIIIGKDMGTVRHIGIKSTRLQTLQGEELVISNKELTSARVNNYKQMQKRRIVFAFGVTYETPTKKLKAIPQIVTKIINSIDLAKIDRIHFKEFADFSLNYEVVYYVDTSDYNKYMDVQQAINLKIKEVFEKEKIEMAYPTQTLFVKKN
jgi:small-conductance mechanosensitive channel